jgi:hypothetical protein
MSLLLLFVGASTAAPVVVTTPTGGDGKPRRGARRKYRSADDELTEAEAQYVLRKIEELKRAKTEREEAAAAKALEIALAQAAHDDDAAEVITEAIEEKKGPRRDYAAALRDVQLMSKIGKELMVLAKEIAAERRRQEDEDDVELLLFL